MEVRRTSTGEISQEVSRYDSYAMLPEDRKGNIRNDMYLVSETLRRMDKAGVPQFSEEDKAVLKSYKLHLDHATKSHPGVGQGRSGHRPGNGHDGRWKWIVITTDAAGRD